jgi:hypothetical protein
MIEGPYKLPEGWRWVRLGELFETINGVWGHTRRGSSSAADRKLAN